METKRICFKTVIHGDLKGEVMALFVDSRKDEIIESFILFEGHNITDIDSINERTKNSTKQEYTTTFNYLKKSYGYNIEIVNSIRQKHYKK